MFSCRLLLKLRWLMRGISSGVAGGSSLALAWKALTALERPATVLDPAIVCEAFAARAHYFDWFSFAAGLITGILLFAFIEAVVTVRWLIISFAQQQGAGNNNSAQPRSARPLYKIL